MNIVTKKLSELKPLDINVRSHPEEQIREYVRSLKKNGQLKLMVIDEDGVIWIGNGLYLAMKEAGYTEAMCLLKEGMSEPEKKKMMLSDNRIFNLGVDDMDMFDAIIKDLGEDLDIPGYDTDWLNMFASDLSDIEEDGDDDICGQEEEATEEPEEESDEEPEVIVPKEPKSKPGEIYQLGSHRLMCGDSTRIADVTRLMDGKKAQLLLTDPPYGVSYEAKAGSIENDDLDDPEFKKFLISAFKAADFSMNPGAAFYIWHADSKGFIFREACKAVGWTVRQCLVWAKNTIVLGRQDYQWKHEPCLYGWKDGASHRWTGDRKQTTILEFDKPLKNDAHPTMKPIRLFERQMLNSTRPGDIVLDLFSGSGTTLIAAEQNERIAYCMEYDPCYVDVIIDRWEVLTGKKAVRL